MSDYKRLLDVYPEPEEDAGIFKGLQNYDVPWKSLNIANDLDAEYYYNHSGQKIISPLVRSRANGGTIDEGSNRMIARIIYHICGESWKRVWDALTIEYSPIENVDASLTETTDRTGSGSHTETDTDTGTDNHTKTGTETLRQEGTDTGTKTGTETVKHEGTDATNHTGTTNTENDVNSTTYHHQYTSDTESNPGGTSETVNGLAGFNSDDFSKDTKSTTTVKQEVTTIHRTLSVKTDKDGNPVKDDDGEEIKEPGKNSDETTSHESTSVELNTHDTEVVNLTDTTTYNTTDKDTIDKTDTTTYNVIDDETLDLQHSKQGSESSTGKEEHTLHRHGNIGVTTNQQMITEEIQLRKNFFFEIVFADLDKYLTLSIY